MPVKVLSAFLCATVLVVSGYWFHIKDLRATLEKTRAQEQSLRQIFEEKQGMAVNLEAYRQQMITIQGYFQALLKQLPERTEVPSLVEDMSRIGLGSGLEFQSIKMQPEKSKGFYVELPIQITLHGDYHQIGEFVSLVSALPRIVTLHDFKIVVSEEQKGSLVMSLVAKTYRYIDEEEP